MRIILIAFLIIPLFVIGQPKAHLLNLQNRVQSQPDGPAKIKAYHSLITEVQGQDPVLSRILIKELSELSERVNSPQGIIWANYQLGYYYNMKGEYDSLRLYAGKCLQLSSKNKFPLSEASGYQLLGTYYWQTGRFDQAVKNHLKALKIRERLNDSTGIGSSFSSLSVVSLSNNELKKAGDYIEKAIVIARQLKDNNLLLRSLHTRANIYGTEGKYKEALNTDNEALKICLKTDNRRNYSEVYSNMALCFFYMGRYDASLSYHYKVLAIDQFFGDSKQIGDTYLNLASVYVAQKNFLKAESLLKKSLHLFRKTKYKYGLRNAYESLSKLYEQNGDYKNAFLATKQYQQVAAQIDNETNDKNIARLNIEYETSKKEQLIKDLNQQATIQALKLQRRNFMLAFIGGLLLLGAGFVLLFFNRRKLLEKARLKEFIFKQQELSAKAVFDAEEEERRRIAAELHDGIGQVLSCALLNLNSLFKILPLKHEQASLANASLQLITESYDEMRSISHRMMPASLAKNGLSYALNEVVNKVDGKDISVQLDLSGMTIKLDPQIETALYRIIQEAINNVIKHAAATKLFISIISDAEGTSLMIEDNGRGFDLAEIGKYEGIGLKNIRSRVEFLKGRVEFESSPGNGTLIAIELPAGYSAENIPHKKGHPLTNGLRELIHRYYRYLKPEADLPAE
jgi:two-component system NarL family sensor kinase